MNNALGAAAQRQLRRVRVDEQLPGPARERQCNLGRGARSGSMSAARRSQLES